MAHCTTLADFHSLEFLNNDDSSPEVLEYLDLSAIEVDATSEEEGSILGIEEIDLEMFAREQQRVDDREMEDSMDRILEMEDSIMDGILEMEDSTDGILEIKDIGMLHSTLEMPPSRSDADSPSHTPVPNEVVSNSTCLFDYFWRMVLLSDESSKWSTPEEWCLGRDDGGSTGRLSIL